jgi:hypothetical protein
MLSGHWLAEIEMDSLLNFLYLPRRKRCIDRSPDCHYSARTQAKKLACALEVNATLLQEMLEWNIASSVV